MVSGKRDVSCETEAKRRGGKVSKRTMVQYVVVKIFNLHFRTLTNLVLYHMVKISICPEPFCKHSLRVGWRNLVQVSLIFAIIVSFMLFTVFPLVYVLYFKEFLIHDTRGFMILKNN